MPTTLSTTTSTPATMASTLLRRQLARTPNRIATAPTRHILPRRTLSSTAALLQAEHVNNTQASGPKSGLELYTVEDLHGMHASEILAETGTRKDAQMRHFTGMLSAHRVCNCAELLTQNARYSSSQLWVRNYE